MPTAQVDIVIRNAIIITVDGQRRILNDGALSIQDGRIVQVGKSADLSGISGKTEIDGTHKIVLPGLINPHAHLSYSLGRSCGDDLPFQKWLPVVYRLEDASG